VQKKKKNTNKINKDQFELVLELNSESIINRLLDPEGDPFAYIPAATEKRSKINERSKTKRNNLTLTKLKKQK